MTVTRTRVNRLAAWSPRSGLPHRQATPADREPPAPVAVLVRDIPYAHAGEVTSFAETLRMVQHPDLYEPWQHRLTLELLAKQSYDARTQGRDTDESRFYIAAFEAFLNMSLHRYVGAYDCDTCRTTVLVDLRDGNPYWDGCPTCGD